MSPREITFNSIRFMHEENYASNTLETLTSF